MGRTRAPRRFVRALLGASLGVLALVATFVPASLAADVTDIGYLDQAALSAIGPFTAANRDLRAYKTGLDGQFARRMRGVRDAATQQRVAAEFQQKLADRQRALFGPLFAKAQVAIAAVASNKNLSVIVDKRIVIVGGTDVTADVVSLLSGPGDPVRPVNSPPPSSVGYVDQAQIDAVPSLKSANDDFQKFQAAEQQDLQNKLRGVKSGADRQQLLVGYQSALADKQKATIEPLVAKTRDAIADVAKKKGLLLVIDRTNLIYGGTDITSDVTSELK